MNTKAVIFSVIALIGTGALLWSGLGGVGRDSGEHEHEEQEERYEQKLASADSDQEHEQARALQQQGDILSLEQILENARRLHQGRVLETELERKGDRYVYEVELVDESGQVWEMKFDAVSGELLEDEREK